GGNRDAVPGQVIYKAPLGGNLVKGALIVPVDNQDMPTSARLDQVDIAQCGSNELAADFLEAIGSFDAPCKRLRGEKRCDDGIEAHRLVLLRHKAFQTMGSGLL